MSNFVSANIEPTKIYYNPPLDDNQKFALRFLQLWITNKCNLKCSFCATYMRDKQEELDFHDIEQIAEIVYDLGCEAVLFSGGGEPTMHSKLDDIIELFYKLNIETALVTNGELLGHIDNLDRLTWCRVSCDDHRDFQTIKPIIEESVLCYPNIDWGLSYIVTTTPDIDNLKSVLRFVNEKKMTHLRISKDIWNAHKVSFNEILSIVDEDLSRLILREPQQYRVRGMKECYLSLVKPLVGADGYVYGCCEALQFNGFSTAMRMGHYSDIPFILQNQRHFDGSGCTICNFNKYNVALAKLPNSDLTLLRKKYTEPSKHLKFL